MRAIQHITIPNSTLRRFLDNNNEIFYLDLDTKEIKSIDVDLTGETPRVMYNTTKEEVFSEEADEYIKREVEDKLGEAFVAIENHIKGKSSDFRKHTKFEEINQKYREIVIKAIAVQNIRRPEIFEQIGLKPPININVFEKGVNVYRRMLRELNFDISIIHKDSTDATFVLPPSHCIFYGDSVENLIIFIPISPYDGLALMTKNYYEECIEDDIHKCLNLRNALTVNNINHSAFISAQNCKNKHLIGYKQQLEYIKEKELLGKDT